MESPSKIFLRQQEEEVARDGADWRVVFDDVRQQLEQRHDNEKGREDAENDRKEKPEAAQDVGIQKTEEPKPESQRIGPARDGAALKLATIPHSKPVPNHRPGRRERDSDIACPIGPAESVRGS